MKRLKAYVVNHGHMDIEWYQPLTVFGEWFCQSIDMLEKIAENEPDYKCYVYDGVVFPVLYAMEKDERLKEKVRKLLDSKKLRLGPFYTQFDEFLACGESIIKNCLWGDRLCRELSTSPMKAGYLLDNFGHPAQLSQILNNFKIKSLFFSRGMCDVGDNVKEFLFCSPDGSQVVAQNFSYGSSFKIYENNSPIPGNPNLMPYYNFGGYGYGTYEYLCDLSKHKDHKGIAEQLIEGVKNAARFYPTGIIPLFVGADHCPPQEGITKTLKMANEMQDEIEFIFSDAEELSEVLSKEAAALPRHSGDLLGSKFDRLLFGATTTRIYLKQDMYNSEHLLFAYALPLKAYEKKLGYETDSADTEEATKLLLLNSTHDSIHGSSLDCVHRENRYRFDKAAQLCAGAIHKALDNISKQLKSKEGYEEFTVFSPRGGEDYISVWLPTENCDIEITDSENRIYKATLAPKKEMLYNAKNQPYYLSPTGDVQREWLFKAKLGMGEVKKFYYRKKENRLQEYQAQEKSLIENEFYSLSIENGRLVFTYLEKNIKAKGFLRFIEEAETGDSFDHSSPWAEAESYDSESFDLSDIKALDCPAYQELKAKCVMTVPLDTIGDLRSKSFVDMPIFLSFKLWKGIKRLDIKISISNRATNHRVRALFCLPHCFKEVKAKESFCTESFGLSRPPMTEGWKEAHTKELPFRDYLSLCTEKIGYTVCAKGLYAFEPIDQNTVAFTLFRGVSELMRINIKSRSSCCMSGIPVPEAQCLGDMDFEFSLFTHDVSASDHRIKTASDSFIYPPLAHSLRRSQNPALELSSFTPFKFIDNSSFVLSLFDLSYDKKHYVLRFYEINSKAKKAKLDLSLFKKVYLSDMNESPVQELVTVDGILELDVSNNKIVTLLLEK